MDDEHSRRIIANRVLIIAFTWCVAVAGVMTLIFLWKMLGILTTKPL